MIILVTRHAPKQQHTVEIEDAPPSAYMLEQTSLYGADVEYSIVTSPDAEKHKKTTWKNFMDSVWFDVIFDTRIGSHKNYFPFRTWFQDECNRLEIN